MGIMIYGKKPASALLHYGKTMPQGNEIGFYTNINAFGAVIRHVRLQGPVFQNFKDD